MQLKLRQASFLASIFLAITTTPVIAKVSVLKAEDASADFPAALKFGTKIEGASVNAKGHLFAVDGSNVVSLSDGTVVLKGPGSAAEKPISFLAGSRFLKNGDLVATDAVGHLAFTVPKGADPNSPLTLVTSDKFLQPNDLAVTACGRFIYFSGMNYTSDSVAGEHGEVGWIDMFAPPLSRSLKKLPKEILAAGQVFRANGIEIIEKGGKEYLYLTSAENKADAVVSTRIIRFEIDKFTGEPKTPTVALDIGARLETEGVITQAELTKVGMDPDGMRADSKGNLYMTLNAFKSVLRWDIDEDKLTLVELKTVFFPVNLEFGGENGDDLVVVGKCEGNAKACVDRIKFEDKPVGRAFSILNGKGGKRRRAWKA